MYKHNDIQIETKKLQHYSSIQWLEDTNTQLQGTLICTNWDYFKTYSVIQPLDINPFYAYHH